jgi:hypothetical protein
MSTLINIVFSSLLLLAPSVMAVQPLDHCPSCKKITPVEPAPIESCPNLMDWEGEKSFLKKWDDKLTGRPFAKLPESQQVTRFLEIFKEFTHDFGTSLLAEGNGELTAAKNRLLSSVGWSVPETWEAAIALVEKDLRIKAAAQNLVCEIISERQARSECEGDPKDLKHNERFTFLKKLEGAVAEFLADGVTVEEMMRARVIPSEGARTRLLVALMERYELPTSLIFAIPKDNLKLACDSKVAGPIRFSLFTVTKTGGSDSVTLLNGTKEGELALKSFPAMGEWVSFVAEISKGERSPSSIPPSIPACFLNASQVKEFACTMWRKQK